MTDLEGLAKRVRLLDLDNARMALFNAINSIEIGRRDDDKSILRNLQNAGFWICAIQPESEEGQAHD